MGNPQGKRWTTEEDKLLIEFYQAEEKFSFEEIGHYMGRTAGAISSRLDFLKVERLRFHSSKGVVLKTREPSVESAYIFGVYLSDGCVVDNKLQLIVIDEDFCEHLRDALLATLNGRFNTRIYSCLNRGQTVYSLHVVSAKLADWLRDSTRSKQQLPEDFMAVSRDIRLSLLAGLMDGDGWISIRKGYEQQVGGYQIGIAANPNICGWIKEMQSFLDQLGIRCSSSFYEKNGMMHIRINPRFFIDRGGYFTIRRKQHRLEVLRQLYNVPSTTKMAAPAQAG